MTSLTLDAQVEKWPIAGGFRISRGSKTEAEVVVATLSDGTHTGRGECVPYTRYGETVEGVKNNILKAQSLFEAFPNATPDTIDIQTLMPAGAARNAIDCALWDLIAKQTGIPATIRAGFQSIKPRETAYTLSLDTPENMAQAAASKQHYPLLKLKLGAEDDSKRMRLIRTAAPNANLIVDANEGWTNANLQNLLETAAETKIDLIEQPLPADNDEALKDIEHLVPICADESVHDRASLTQLSSRYDAINIKLDKTGGLTEALQLLDEAKKLNLKIMVGCMVGTSLAMAPAMLIAQRADWVDLDGPLLLEKDREPGLQFDGAIIHPPTPELWG